MESDGIDGLWVSFFNDVRRYQCLKSSYGLIAGRKTFLSVSVQLLLQEKRKVEVCRCSQAAIFYGELLNGHPRYQILL